MILVDTSIWIDHLRNTCPPLVGLLEAGQVCTHPFVIGELACGSLRNRAELLHLLRDLPGVAAASDEEVLFLIERHRLMGRGIGYIDVHLLAAAAIHPARLWTRDRKLAGIAAELGVSDLPEAS